ncbi:hypothetical protein BaRGS_00005076 [Batillaria attramentaria]|uniref:15-hydroxyprostaglandin dehydrogenase [NAD(+)] n=1 Tax=Batillaria attramentaria TaxID=370345 RepID=A0ABD0LVJ9_9CAEN
MSLNGKVALVTGAAQGLGKAFSEALLKKGAKVCLVDVQVKEGEATTAEFQKKFGKDKALFVRCDVTSKDEFEETFRRALKHFGHLDIMVNNAGIGNERDYIRMVNINLTGVITGTNLAIQAMSRENGGHGGLVLNVSSTAGLTPRAYFEPAYSGTKFGVVGFTRSWSFNPHAQKMGIRFACLCPAFTATRLLDGANTILPEEARKMIEMVGINKVDSVVDGFMQLVEDEQCNGAVMTVVARQGIKYHKKPHALSKI